MKKIQCSYNKCVELLSEAVQTYLLTEIASPVVWHFTTPEALLSILADNKFKLSDADGDFHQQNTMLTGYREKAPYYFSTTRSKSSHDGYSRTLKSNSDNGAVRIQINGDKLNRRLHAKAGNFHAKNHAMYSDKSLKGAWTDNFVNKVAKMSDIRNDEAPSRNEKEDTFWSQSDTIEDAINYIQRIDILVYRKTELLSDIKAKCYELGVPLYLYDNEQAFNMQSNDYFDEERAFNTRLKQATEAYNNGLSMFYAFDDVIELPEYTAVCLNGRWNYIDDNGEYVFDKWETDAI